jgi:hypothetical protein
MALPSSYTEASFSDYLHAIMGQVADLLGWKLEEGSYDEVINDTLLAYGVSDIADATDIKKVRALGKLCLWRAVLISAIPEINYTADGTTMNREAIFQHAQAMLERATAEAAPYDAEYVSNYVYDAEIIGVSRADPYQYTDPDE